MSRPAYCTCLGEAGPCACADPAEPRDLAAFAAPDCYGCMGTGRIVGFGRHGDECLCVARCEACDDLIAWGHDDERAPRECARCAAMGVAS